MKWQACYWSCPRNEVGQRPQRDLVELQDVEAKDWGEAAELASEQTDSEDMYGKTISDGGAIVVYEVSSDGKVWHRVKVEKELIISRHYRRTATNIEECEKIIRFAQSILKPCPSPPSDGMEPSS